jgi:hypothetical protein
VIEMVDQSPRALPAWARARQEPRRASPVFRLIPIYVAAEFLMDGIQRPRQLETALVEPKADQLER